MCVVIARTSEGICLWSLCAHRGNISGHCLILCFFSPSDLTGYIVKHDSETMFGENLHNVTDLSWTYNGAMEKAIKQTALLVRESGIQVEIVLHNTNLVPMFEESPKEYDESVYDISGLDDQQQIVADEFIHNYCRHV